MTTERWYRFTAYNEQPMYGYGTPQEADQYADILNRDREFKHYWPLLLGNSEAKELALDGEMADAFDLGEALDAAWELGDEA